MKIMTALIVSLFAISAYAQSSQIVFQCTSLVKIDENESTTIGISIVQQDSAYISTYVGSAETGEVNTVKQTFLFEDSLKINGVKEILKATNLNNFDQSKITKVEVYTAGNFDDDLAGVRTAQFFKENGLPVAKGMFFGWAGAVSCQ